MDHARTKTAQINLRIKPDLKAAAERAAAADHRSLTSLVEKLLTDHCEKFGFPIEPVSRKGTKAAKSVSATKRGHMK
jgi:hypothetical protein